MIQLRSLAAIVAATVVLAACGSADYEKTKSGLLYKIVKKGSGNVAKKGEFLKVQYTQKINDSLLGSSTGSMPAYAMVDSVGPVYNVTEIFGKLRKGDSVVAVQLADTLEKKGMMAPFMKKGDRLVLGFKVVDIIKDQAAMMADQQKEAEVIATKSAGAVENMIKDKKVTASKVGDGTYVEIKEQGNGIKADSGKYVTVHYTGKNLETGKVFESSKDAGRQPYSFVLGQGNVIKGWDEGLKLLNKGAKATLYIPGKMAYGPQPGPNGKPFENLLFDVELVDVQDKAPAQPKMPMPQQMPDTTGKRK
jgi:FKBP-type peptidyl-prolyl cis-trans isomerase FkpA